MKKALKILAIIFTIILVIMVAALGFGLLYVNHYIQTPEFKQKLTGLAGKATGTTVKLDNLDISLIHGIELQGVAVSNPSGFHGDFVTAQSFTLHYRLWPLFHEHVDIQTLSLDTPVIHLVRNAQGQWNYDKLSGRTGNPKPTATAKPSPDIPKSAPLAPSATLEGLQVTLSNLEMKNATVTMATDDGKQLLLVQNASYATSLNSEGYELTALGSAKIELVNASNSLFVRNIATPVSVTPAAVKLNPLTGKVAGGDISGDVALSLAGDSRYTLNLQIKDADVVTLLKEAGVSPQIFTSGKLQITSALTGTGGVETIVGGGKIEINGGQIMNIPLLSTIASLLQISVLQDLKFDECLIQYTLSNNVVETPVINLKSPQIQITGQGEVTLADNELNHSFTMTFSKGVLNNTPKEIREAFTAHEDGSYSIDFKVWGPYTSPKTDLDKHLLKAVGNQLLQRGIKLLK